MSRLFLTRCSCGKTSVNNVPCPDSRSEPHPTPTPIRGVDGAPVAVPTRMPGKGRPATTLRPPSGSR